VSHLGIQDDSVRVTIYINLYIYRLYLGRYLDTSISLIHRYNTSTHLRYASASDDRFVYTVTSALV